MDDEYKELTRKGKVFLPTISEECKTDDDKKKDDKKQQYFLSFTRFPGCLEAFS